MKITKENIVLSITFICMSIIIFLSVTFLVEQKNMNEVSNGLYTANSITFSSFDDQQWHNSLPINGSYRMFVEYTEQKTDKIRGYYQKESNFTPPLINGVFFPSNSDKKSTALIGQQVKENIVKENGESYYIYNNQKFHIIGIMGESYATKLDNLVLLNLPSISITEKLKLDFVLDGNSNTEDYFNDFQNWNQDITQTHHSKKGLTKLIDTDFYSNIILLVTAAMVIISIIRITIYWFSVKSNYFFVINILGISFRKLFIQMFLKYLTIATISLFIPFVILISSANKYLISNILILNGFLYIGTLILSSITFLFISNQTKRSFERVRVKD